MNSWNPKHMPENNENESVLIVVLFSEKIDNYT